MKKGFTLIELLAVILILGIIALIAIPQVTNVIEDAREQANLRSIEGHIKNIENNLAVNLLNKLSLKGIYSFEDLNFTNYQANDDIKCDFYEIDKIRVTEATKCMINGKSYCYSNGKGFLCNVIDQKSYAQANGQLHVCGTEICNENNQKIRLMGASLSNGVIGQTPNEYSKKALSQLKSWGANLLRIFVDGQASWNGMYAYIGNESNYLNSLYEAIDNAIANDMYVIVNWASHASNFDPLVETASTMFTQVANKYKNDPHIIYEIWNESGNQKTWNDIKIYANQVIPVIRSVSPNAIILVATPANDSQVDVVINDQLSFNNIMYTHHLYATGYTDSNINRLVKAINAGIPIFETEWAATDTGEALGDDVYEAQGYDFAKILDKYNISYAMFCFHATKWSYGFVKQGQWDENLPTSILKPNGLLFKKVLTGNYESKGHVMRGFPDDANAYRSDEWINKIEQIEFANRINISKNAEKTWDLSLLGDNSIVGYVTKLDNSSLYKLTIATNGYVNAPSNSRYLFQGMTKLKSINFNNFKTTNMTSMLGMFQGDTNLEELDLSSFDVSRVNSIGSTFSDCTNLKRLNLSGWNIKPTVMSQTFSNLTQIEELDLTGINVENISNFQYMFYRNTNLKRLNISTWNPQTVTSIKSMFYNTSHLEVLDMSNFNFNNDVTDTNSFVGMKANAIIYVKNNDIKNKVLSVNPNLDVRIK